MAKHDFGSSTEDLAVKMNKIKETLAKENSDEKKDKKRLEISPKLFVSGRLDRKGCGYSIRTLSLLKSVEEEIKMYCRGGETAILNYLIMEGLEKVKKSSSVINFDTSNMS